MPLVNAKCTNCGANLEVDSARDAAICPYCGSAYIVEKAINNYNITNNTTNNINAEVVNVYGGVDTGFKTRGGVLEKYEGESIDIIIPETVIIIGTNSFSGCYGIRSVKIPEGVETIEPCAFSKCTGLQSVSIPGSVKTIGDGAFFRCVGLQNVAIAEGVNTIGRDAFSRCEGLQSVSIPGSVKTIGEQAFFGCYNLQEVSIAEGVETIEPSVFSKCTGLRRVSIPGSVKIIGKQAFSDCVGLKNVSIGEGVEQIGKDAFSGCNLQSMIIPGSIKEAEKELLRDYATMDAFREEDILNDDLPQSVFKRQLISKFKREKRCLKCGGERIAIPKKLLGTKYVCKNCGEELPEYLYVKEYYDE